MQRKTAGVTFDVPGPPVVACVSAESQSAVRAVCGADSWLA